MQVISKPANICAELRSTGDKNIEQSLISKALGGTHEQLGLWCGSKIWQSSA